MDENYIAFMSYSVGSGCFATLILLLVYLRKQKLVHPFLVFAACCSLLWSTAIAANYQHFTLPREGLLLLETLRCATWIVALIVSVQFVTGQRLPRIFRAMLHSLWMISFILIGTLIVLKNPMLDDGDLLIWNSLILAIAGLVAVEQLYRNARHQRMMKLLSICIGALFAYDL